MYPVTILRTEQLRVVILRQAQSVLQNLFHPEIMKYHMRQVDLMNKNSFYYLERLNCYEILETHIMDRVMLEYWKGDLDASGSFFHSSTSIGILRNSSTKIPGKPDFDFEYEHRFYRSKSK